MKLNKLFFTILSAFAVCAGAMASNVTFQDAVLTSLPATVATTVTTNLAAPPVAFVGKQSSVTFEFSFNQSGASTSNVVYTLHRSLDNATWDTNSPITITVASQGATRVDYFTNINTAGVGYIRLYSIANATALTTMTNFGVQYGVKTDL
jgi:hypothetical protein